MKPIVCGAFILGVAFSANALAGKVEMPKEGSYEFYWCHVGNHMTMSVPDKVFVSHYHLTANAITQPPGRPFDRSGAACYGTHANLSGRIQEFGVCEVSDADGDKWWMEYHSNAEGSGGTYTAAHGTGKYDGMTVKGQYVLGFWPTAKDVAFQGCNRNTGSYKFK